MAQPKIIANLGKLQSVKFSGDLEILGLYDSNTTLLDNVFVSGIYIFTSVNPAEHGFSSAVTDGTNGIAFLLTVINLANSSENLEQLLKELIVDRNIVKTIQIVERLGTVLGTDSSREIYYREYCEADAGDGFTWSAWYEGGGGSKVTCDTAISSTSENPVQNKVIAAALEGKSNSGHTHAQYATTTALANKLDKSGGTLTGALVAQANTNYTTYQVRNIALNTSASTPTGNGSILGVYS